MRTYPNERPKRLFESVISRTALPRKPVANGAPACRNLFGPDQCHSRLLSL